MRLDNTMRQMSTIICPVHTMSGGEHVVYCCQTGPEECITCKPHQVLSHHYSAHREWFKLDQTTCLIICVNVVHVENGTESGQAWYEPCWSLWNTKQFALHYVEVVCIVPSKQTSRDCEEVLSGINIFAWWWPQLHLLGAVDEIEVGVVVSADDRMI